MKTLVVYKSKSGFTQKYAQWIAAELAADLVEATKVNAEVLTAYDTVIYGGGLYAVGINGVKLITNNLERLSGKKVVVFATGASPGRDAEVAEVLNRNFTVEQQQQIRFFYLRGGFDFSKLKAIDKSLMSMMKWKLQQKPPSELAEDDRELLAAYEEPIDFCSRQNIEPLLNYVKNG